jgi:hypothetical protein
VRACYVIRMAARLSFWRSMGKGDGGGTAGQGGGTRLGSQPCRQTDALPCWARRQGGLADGPVRSFCATLGRLSTRVRDRHRLAEPRRGSGSKATRARPRRGTPYFCFFGSAFPTRSPPESAALFRHAGNHGLFRINTSVRKRGETYRIDVL